MPRPPEKHICEDFEADDPDDILELLCVCGHVIEEHEPGFFRPCKFDTSEDTDG